MLKLWLDDIRQAPPGWHHVRTVPEAIKIAESETVHEMSLDHDLGLADPCAPCRESLGLAVAGACAGVPGCRCDCHNKLQPSGYDFVKWMADTGRWPLAKPTVHSANPVGAKAMRDMIERHWFDLSMN